MTTTSRPDTTPDTTPDRTPEGTSTETPGTAAVAAATVRRRQVLTAGAAVLVVAGIALAVLRPPWLTEPLQAAVEAGGVAAPLVFVVLCILSVPVHLTPVLVVLSPLLFPLPEALVLSLVGSVLGCVVTAAALARAGAAAARGSEGWPAWLTRLSRQVDRRPLLIGVLVRLVLNTGLAVEAFFVLTGYSRRTYLAVTVSGITLWVAQAIVGVTVLHALSEVSPLLALAAFVVPLVSITIPIYLRRRRRRRLAAAS